MSRVSPVSVAFCCALANEECFSQPPRYRMSSVMLSCRRSALRVSGSRCSSISRENPRATAGSAVTCFGSHVASVWPWSRCQAKVKKWLTSDGSVFVARLHSLLMDVSSRPRAADKQLLRSPRRPRSSSPKKMALRRASKSAK